MSILTNAKLWFNKVPIFILVVTLMMSAGCSGGGGGSVEDSSLKLPSFSGVIQKGLYTDGTISAQKVEENGTILSAAISSSINSDGEYSISHAWDGLTLLSADGRFFNEYTGETNNESMVLYSLVNLQKDSKINLNLFTSLEASRVITLMQEGSSYVDALAQTKSALSDVFGLAQDVNATDLDIFDVNSSLKDANQNLLLLSGTFLKIISDYDSSSVASKSISRAIPLKGDSVSPMDMMREDFSKNGKVDTLFKKEWEKMIEDDEEKTRKVIDTNLHIKDREYKVPERSWTKRLRLSVSEPSYTYITQEGVSVLTSITYNITLPQANFTNRTAIYEVDYTTVEGTAHSPSDYDSTSGNVKFSYNENSKSIIIPINRQSQSAMEFTLRFSEDYDALIISNPDILVSIPADTYSSATDLLVNAFSLAGVSINDFSTLVNESDDFVLIGSNSSSTSLNFFIRTITRTNAAYFADIKVMVAGEEDLVLKSNIFMPTTTSIAGRAYIQISDVNVAITDTLKNYIKNAYNNGKSVTYKFVAHTAEDSTVESVSKTLPRLVQISQNMVPRTTISNLDYTAPLTEACQGTQDQENDFNNPVQYALVNIESTYQPNGTAQNIGARYTDACVRLDYNEPNNEFDVTLISGSASLDEPIIANLAGLDIEITTSGITDAQVIVSQTRLLLPPEHSVHIGNLDGTISPRGLTYLSLTSRHFTHDEDISQESFDGNFGNYYLHGKNLPFSFHLRNYKLDSNNFLLWSDKHRYVFDYEDTHISNTGRFNSPQHNVIELALNSDGISSQSTVKFNDTTSKTNYPKANTTTEAYGVEIQNSQIVAKTLESSDTLAIDYLQNCYGGECSAQAQRDELNVTSESTTIYSDGSFVSLSSTAVDEVSWGSKDGSSVFTRANDSDARVFVPGFELPTNDPTQIVKYLLGTAQPQETTMDYKPTWTGDAKQGRELFAGINVGNLKDSASNSLNGNNMSVSVGDDVLLNAVSNNYSKYYVRGSGVTGLFNNSNKIETVIYGYPMAFDSFKFSQINNTLEPYTKIDGAVEVIGKGDFDVNFNNLAMDCTGNLLGGHISDEQGETILNSWSIASTLTSIDFKSPDGATCTNSKSLALGHVIKVAALKKRLGIDTFWSSAGLPFDTVIVGSTYNQLDGNSSLDGDLDNGGYDIALESLALESSDKLSTNGQDWIETNAVFGLPFWGTNDMSMRLVNADKNTRAPSVVTKKGELFIGRSNELSNEELVSSINSNYSSSLSQDWFGIMNFSLPVYYNATNDISLTPQFLGRTLSSDLIVMKADAGINYVSPDATAMSFGASANFAVLKGLKLHVDLTDPNSLREIDETLSPYIGIDRPLQDSIGELLENIKIGNKLLKSGMSLAMEESMMFALEEAGGGVNDPFEIISQANAQMHTIPVVIRDRFQEVLEEQIRNLIREYNVAVGEYDVDPGVDLAELRNTLRDALREPIAEYREYVEYLETINDKLSAIPAMTGANGTITKTKEFIYDNAFGSRECKWENFTNKGFFKPIGQANTALQGVNDKLQSMSMTKIESFAQKASDFTGLDSQDLVSTAQTVKDLTGDVNELVTNFNRETTTYFSDDFCPSFNDGMATLDTVYEKVAPVDEFKVGLQDDISAALLILKSADVENLILSIENISVDTNLTQKENEITALILTPIMDKIDAQVAIVQRNIPNISASDLRRIFVTKTFELDAVVELNAKLNVELTPIADQLNSLALQVFSGFDKSVNKLLAQVNDEVNKLLAEATSVLENIPLASGSIDGYAVFYGDSLQKLHVGSEFAVTGKDEDSSFGFNAALDIENAENNDSIGCGGDGTSSNLYAVISTRDISMPLGTKELKVDLLYLGVTIGSPASVEGIFGGISSESGFDYDTFKLYGLGLASGIGVEETYLGAKASATMDDLQFGVSFLVGQLCNRMVFASVVPKAINDFITIPENRFNGGLVYGEGQMPIWANGCALTVNARAKIGTWFIFGPPKSYGGIVGGGAFGRALCIASLGGEVEVLAEKSGDTVRFQGTGWGAAGVGSCSSSWSSVRKSRKDSWCGTGDARFGASYDNGWTVEDIRTSAVH